MIANIFGATAYLCLCCGYRWQSVRPIKPPQCPKCLAKDWNIHRPNKKEENALLAEEINSLFNGKSTAKFTPGRMEVMDLRNTLKRFIRV